MCRGDTTLITFRWGTTVKLPQPDFTLEHTCVDWDQLMVWASEHSINVFDEGMLVHPTLGRLTPMLMLFALLTLCQVRRTLEVSEMIAHAHQVAQIDARGLEVL